MSEKIGLLGALGILGEKPETVLGKNVIRVSGAMLCIQGMEDRAVPGQPPMRLSSGVVILVDSPQIDLNTAELLIGTLYLVVEERYRDTDQNLRGHGLAGLATDGGFDRDEYAESIGPRDLRNVYDTQGE